MLKTGEKIYDFATELFPICRSITGQGVKDTLQLIQKKVKRLSIKSVPSGYQAFDWVVPREWNIYEAYLEDGKKNRIIDFRDNNLHVMSYSMPLDVFGKKENLRKYIITNPEYPNAIPYATSYYKEKSSLCMSQNQFDLLKDDEEYHIVIRSSLQDGELNYGEIYIPGKIKKEILISTYICHPSMANNEVSGPSVATYLAKYLLNRENYYSYRIIFCPETIGAITFLSKNLEYLKENVVSGFVLTCVGDNNNYSFVQTRYGDTLTDKLLDHVLKFQGENYKKYSFLQRGSDERQYCAPNVDLPVCTVCRTKFHEYPEYHSSNDDLTLISPEGLYGTYELLIRCINILECNKKYRVQVCCEPQLGKRGLYQNVGMNVPYGGVKGMLDFIAYADGKNDLIDIGNIIEVPAWELIEYVKVLNEHNLLGENT